MFTIEDGLLYDLEQGILSLVDLANYTGDVSDVTIGNIFAGITIVFVLSLVLSGPKYK